MWTEGIFMLPAEAERELVARIKVEMQERLRQPGPTHRLPTDLPGDHLVCLVGELALSIPPPARRGYEATLWPDVRQVLGSPGNLTAGSYDWAIAETERLFLPEMKRFTLAAAQSGDKAAKAASVLAMRLDAGFFLAGLEALWPREAPLLLRRVWNVCGLGRWDDLLERNTSELSSHAAVLRRLLADSPARLDRERFGVLLRAAQEKGFLKVAEASDRGAYQESEPLFLRPWQRMLVHDFLSQFFPDEMESGEFSLFLDEPSGLSIIRCPDKEYGVLFLEGSQESAEIPIHDSTLEERLSRLAGLWVFETPCDEKENHQWEDEPLASIRLAGVLSASFLKRKKEESESGAWFLRFNRSDVIMDDHSGD